MKKISVVIPVYNMGHSLEKCLESIMNQSYENFEIILVDDGSRDNSYEICEKLARKDSRIKIIHTENRGSGPARNTGIDIASGEYIYFPDADDILDKDSLKILAGIVDIKPYDIIVFGYRSINSEGKILNNKKYQPKIVSGKEVRKSYFPYMTMTSPFGIQGAPWNKLFKLSIIKDKKLKFPSLRRHQDDAFIGTYMGYVDDVCFIENIFYTYYLNDLSKEWDKYPESYLDAVMGLNKIRKETIWLWNKEDKATHDILRCEFICNAIKALELSFSPKRNLSFFKRRKWIINSIDQANLNNVDFPNVKGYEYQKKIMQLISKRKHFKLYIFLYVKVFLQKNLFYFYSLIKRENI